MKDRRLSAAVCVILAFLVVSGVMLTGNECRATIHYSGVQNKNLDGPAFSLFGASGAWDDARFGLYCDDGLVFLHVEFSSGVIPGGVEYANGVWGSPIPPAPPMKKFASSEVIGPAEAYDDNTTLSLYRYEKCCPGGIDVSYSAFNAVGYAGIKMVNGLDTYYGWIQISVDNYDNCGISVTAIDWAYEDSGQAIQAGAMGLPVATKASTWGRIKSLYR